MRIDKRPMGALTMKQALRVFSKKPVRFYRVNTNTLLPKVYCRAFDKNALLQKYAAVVEITYDIDGLKSMGAAQIPSDTHFIFTNYWHAYAFLLKLKEMLNAK